MERRMEALESMLVAAIKQQNTCAALKDSEALRSEAPR